MTSQYEFDKQLIALDQEKLNEFLVGVISMYEEYINVHMHRKESAQWNAINEMVTGTQAAIDLYKHGEMYKGYDVIDAPANPPYTPEDAERDTQEWAERRAATQPQAA